MTGSAAGNRAAPDSLGHAAGDTPDPRGCSARNEARHIHRKCGRRPYWAVGWRLRPLWPRRKSLPGPLSGSASHHHGRALSFTSVTPNDPPALSRRAIRGPARGAAISLTPAAGGAHWAGCSARRLSNASRGVNVPDKDAPGPRSPNEGKGRSGASPDARHGGWAGRPSGRRRLGASRAVSLMHRWTIG